MATKCRFSLLAVFLQEWPFQWLTKQEIVHSIMMDRLKSKKINLFTADAAGVARIRPGDRTRVLQDLEAELCRDKKPACSLSIASRSRHHKASSSIWRTCVSAGGSKPTVNSITRIGWLNHLDDNRKRQHTSLSNLHRQN